MSSMWHGLDMYGLIRPWARYVRRRCLGAWLTWMCLTTRLPVSRPLVSAFASAFLRSPTSSSSVSSHWDGLLVLLDVLEELYSALQFPSVDSLCCLSGVLEGDTQVRSTRTSGLRWVYLSGGVTDHLDGWRWSLVVPHVLCVD